MVYTCIEYYSALKKGNPSIGDNMDEPGGRYAKGHKPVTKRQRLQDPTCMRYLK